MKFFSIAKIDIDLHWTFLLLFAFALLAGGFDTVTLLIVLFGSVVLHELSHSLVARMYGVRVKRIILLPIGGMAMIEEFAMAPAVELRVAIAGPAMSFLLALIFLALSYATAGFEFLSPLTTIASSAFEANILLGAFNLLPALPLDGGRVWRALRQRRRDYLGATRDAVRLSKAIVVILFLGSIAAALLFAAWGFLLWNTIIALFIFLGSGMELDAAIFKTSSDGLFVRDAMRKKAVMISGEKSMREAFILALAERVTSLLVKTHSEIPVVLRVGSFERIPRAEWAKRRLNSLHFASIHVSPDTPAVEAWKRMRTAGVELAPVVSSNKLVGIVWEADLERLIYLKKIALVS